MARRRSKPDRGSAGRSTIVAYRKGEKAIDRHFRRRAVATRGARDEAGIKTFSERFPNAAETVDLLKVKLPDISGSDIRDRLTKGEPVAGQLPGLVEDYIKRWSLYRVDKTAAATQDSQE